MTMKQSRGSIAFFGTYRPPVALDIFSCPADPPPSSAKDEVLLTDDKSYNQNGQPIPAPALKELLTFLAKKNPKLASECGATPDDAATGRVTGLVFVSERESGLETLHVALRSSASGKVIKVMSPAVSPSGKKVAVANFRDNRWNGEIENLKTDIVVMNLDRRAQGGRGRDIVIKDGGWPTWGSDDVLFFHRGFDTARWAVFRYDMRTRTEERVTLDDIDAMTPAAISETKVAVATVREKSKQVIMKVERTVKQYRHIEIFDTPAGWPPVQITQRMRPEGDHYNPFVLDGGKRIGYHRCRTDKLLKVVQDDGEKSTSIQRKFTACCPQGRMRTLVYSGWSIKGRVTGLVFVSERESGLETLHVALRSTATGKVIKVMSLGEIYGASTFGGVRMEDSGCIAEGFTAAGGVSVGYSLVYVSTKEPVKARRVPWTVVYRTVLADGKTERMTPPGQYDLSPAVSPSGKMVAVANFRDNRWNGEIENLKTDIFVMNVDRRAQGNRNRCPVIKDGGWPTWGSDDVIFFHRGFDTSPPPNTARWAVFRYDMRTGREERVTPEDIDAMTPAAINETKVAVATVREKSKQVIMKVERTVTQYRHIEIFDMAGNKPPVQVTQRMRPEGDHYSPFVLDRGRRIGYHRCRTDKLLKVVQNDGEKSTSIQRNAKDIEKGVVPVPVRVVHSAPTIAGHVNHPVFSPDMRSIVFAADLAAVSADPISMPHFTHSVRPYGDIFSVDLRDITDIAKNKDIKDFHRITHSRYEYSTPTWAGTTDHEEDPNAKWKMLESVPNFTPRCPYVRGKDDEKEGWHMTGHLTIQKRCC
ncbi:unnamed protein product [Urochloa decumbens]|uniref:Uncharacterized protein n=1 Tax=Urochloa decumbens TaxID=240449 RepID=A0ABC9B3A4_9POAL